MLKLGNFRIGAGLAHIDQGKQKVTGLFGTKKFVKALRDELGFDASRPFSNSLKDTLVKEHEALD